MKYTVVKNLRKDNNWYFSCLLASTVFFTPLRSTLIYIANIFYAGSGRILSLLSVMLFLGVIILPVLKNIKVTKGFVLIYGFVLLSWLWSFMFNSIHYKAWISEGIDIFIKALPFYLVTKNISDWSVTKKILYKAAELTVLLMTLLVVLGKIRGDLFVDGLGYSQFYGVILSPAAVICMLAMLELHNLKYLCLFIIAVGEIVLFGARMPIACILVAAVVYMINSVLCIKRGKHCITRIGLCMVAVAMILCVGGVVAIIWLRNQEMTTIAPGYRIIYQIINGEFTVSSGRSQIYQIALECIADNPIIGTGIIADRFLIAEGMKNLEAWQGYYAHNIFLELWMQYGFFGGTLMICAILYVLLNLIIRTYNSDRKIVAMYIIAETFGILLLSGPVFNNQHFWLMLGLNVLGSKESANIQNTYPYYDID